MADKNFIEDIGTRIMELVGISCEAGMLDHASTFSGICVLMTESSQSSKNLQQMVRIQVEKLIKDKLTDT